MRPSATKSAIEIRKAALVDVPAITRIYVDAVLRGTASFEIKPPDEAEMARRMNTLLADNYPYLVAALAGEVVGYAYAGPYRARPAYRWSVEDSIYVGSQFHRKGIGRALLVELIAESEARGYRQMIGIIGDTTNAASVAVHAAVGFRLIGTFQSIGFKHGQWLDTVLMQRALGAGDTTAPQTEEQ